jgi:hypothetical protein
MINDFSEDIFAFYSMTEKYRNSPTERLSAMAQQIYKRFFCNDVNLSTELPPSIAAHIIKEMTKETFVHDSTLFCAANMYIFHRMKSEWLGRFLYSGVSVEILPLASPSSSSGTLIQTPGRVISRNPNLPSTLTGSHADNRADEIRYSCKVDRSLRRSFQRSIQSKNFDFAIESFEILRDAGSIPMDTGYHKGIYLLQSIANEQQKKYLQTMCIRDGVQIDFIEGLMTNLTCQIEEKLDLDRVASIASGITMSWVGARKLGEERLGKVDNNQQRAVSFCSTFVPQRSFVEKEKKS